MWMVETNDRAKETKMSLDHPVYGRKLRPLMPRPTSCCTTTKISPYSTTSTPPCCCVRNTYNLPWNQPISGYGVKREMIERVSLVSTRWNPTPEQLQALEEMYKRGITTPSAEQIQQIAANLRRFGKIEGKNVFYWFQNHKARERQKKRRQLELLAGKKTQQAESLETKKQTGLNRRDFEFEHQNMFPTPSNSSTPSEDAASMHGAVIAERKIDEWTQLNQKIVTAKKETCWQLDLSSCLPSNNSVQTITAQRVSGQENANPFGALNLSMLLPPKNDNINLESRIKENQTLQLFPIGSNDNDGLNAGGGEEVHDVSCIGTKFRPNEFIEFLPMKL